MSSKDGVWVPYKEASERLAETYEKIKQGLIAAQLIHADETGIHIGKKLHWLHTACTRFLTFLQWHQKRGRVAIDEMGILPQFTGRVMRDRRSLYDHYACSQSVCGSHLLRDSAGIAQYAGQQWATRMEEALETMNNMAHFWRDRGATSVPKPLRDTLVAQYFDILALGYAAHPHPLSPRPFPNAKGHPNRLPPRICWMPSCIELIRCWLSSMTFLCHLRTI